MLKMKLAMLALALSALGTLAYADTPTDSPTPTNTDVDTFTPTPTNTDVDTFTPTPTNTNTDVDTFTPTPTVTPSATNTPASTFTNTRTRTVTTTRTVTRTSTITRTFTISPTATPTPLFTPPAKAQAVGKASSLGSVNQDVVALANKVVGATGSAIIRVIPSHPGPGRLEIFSSGRRFRDLGTYDFPAGITAVTWDLTDEQGRRAPSGRYTVYYTDSTGAAHRTYLLVIR